MSTQPLYKSVRDQIVQSLVRHEWQPGQTMPSERELAARYGVGISTVRAAIGELVSANVLTRMQGKGTYIAHHSARDNLYRFFNVVGQDGTKASFQRELLSLKKAKADAQTAASLKLRRNGRADDVHKARILLSSGTAPFAVADIALPMRLFPGLEARSLPDGEESLYAIYQAHFGINVVKVVEQLVAVIAAPAVGRVLRLVRGEPVLQIRRLAYTFNDLPVEQRLTWVNTRHHHYLITQGGA
jgi:GntR family transcriptional regulator